MYVHHPVIIMAKALRAMDMFLKNFMEVSELEASSVSSFSERSK